MNAIEIDLKKSNIDWNSVVKSVSEGTIYQTTYWADYVKGNDGVNPLFFIVQDDDGKILGSLLAHEETIFRRFLKYGVLGNLLFKMANKRKTALTWHYGPLIYDKSRFDEIFSTLLKKVEASARERRMLFLKNISFPIHGDDIYFKRAEKIFHEQNFNDSQNVTIFVPLAKDEDALWKSLKNSARKVLKKTDEGSLEIGPLKKEELEEYYSLLRESRRRVGIEMPPTYPNRYMWEAMNKDGNHLDVFSVRKDGRLLAAIGITCFNGIVFETGPAQANFCLQNRIYANDILKWEVIKRYSKESRVYDLSGIPREIKSEKERGQAQFKEKWGGYKVAYKYFSKSLIS